MAWRKPCVSDDPANPVLAYLRVQFAWMDQRFDTLERKANETITRVSAVERTLFIIATSAGLTIASPSGAIASLLCL